MEHNCTNSTSINMSLPDFLDSLQQQTTLVMIPTLCFLAMLGVTGLVGNSLILVVFSRRIKSNSTIILLMTIAAFDLVANVGALPVEVLTVIWTWNFHDAALCKTKVFLNSFTTIGSLIALVAVAVVRYRKICTPHGWQVTRQQAKLTCLVSVILAVLLPIPAVVLYGPGSKLTSCDKILGHECYVSDQYRESGLVMFNNGLYVFLYVFTSIPLTAMYILIGIQANKLTVKLKVPNLANGNVITPISMTASTENPIELKSSNTTIESGNGSMANTEFLSTELSSTSVPPSSSSLNFSKNRTLDADHLDASSYSCIIKNKFDDQEHKGEKDKYYLSIHKENGVKTNSSAENSIKRTNSSSLTNPNIEDQHANYNFTESSHHNSHADFKRTLKFSKILKFLKGDNRSRNTGVLSRNKNKRRRVTKMLIIITSIFVISYLIFLLLSFFRNFMPRQYESMNRAEMAIFHFFFRMYFLNSAANCIIYGLCDPNFRRECLSVIRCGSRTPKL